MDIKLVPLAEKDREQFIIDNQWAFKHGAMIEFGERDNSINSDGEIISLYLDETICITARFSDMVRRNFAFYSNGSAVKIYGMEFYE